MKYTSRISQITDETSVQNDVASPITPHTLVIIADGNTKYIEKSFNLSVLKIHCENNFFEKLKTSIFKSAAVLEAREEEVIRDSTYIYLSHRYHVLTSISIKTWKCKPDVYPWQPQAETKAITTAWRLGADGIVNKRYVG